MTNFVENMNNVKSIIDELKETSSSNTKKEILENIFKNDPNHIIFRIFYVTYNKFIQYNIKKIKTVETNSLRRNDFINDDFFELLDSLSSRKITGNNARDEVTKFLEQYIKEYQEIFIGIIQKNLKIGISETTINKILPKAYKYRIPVFKVQLANKLDFKKHYKKEFYISAKLDGIRGIAFNDTNYLLMKRSGKLSEGMEHITESLNKLNEVYYKKHKINIKFFDGEMFSPDIHFSEIQSAVSSFKNVKEGSKEVIALNIFAVDSEKIKNTHKMIETMKELKEMIKENNIPHLMVLQQNLVKFEKDSFKEQIENLNKNYVAEGYEGIMLRDVKTHYEFKRGKALLKYKSFFEDDFKVIDIEEGTGNFAGTMGALICSGIKDGKEIKFNVGTGFKEEERKMMWNNKEDIIGKTIEVKYQEISKDVNGNYSLRFPVFQKIKNDR